MANSYLTHTHGSSATLLTKGTFSAWIKRSAPSGEQTVFTGNNAANNQRDFVRFEANSQLRARGCGGDFNLETTQVFRDTSAWYHIVVSIDTTQGTAADRVKMYVNGSQVTAFNSPSYPSQNYTLEGWSNQTLQTVGRDGKDNNTPFDGYLSHVAWVDGSVLAPTVFGQTDSTSGIWKFKSPSGVTWGNNGFHLKFENSGNLGLDSSGNTNNFTVNGNLRQALDTPSNVSATLNSLIPMRGTPTYESGNTYFRSNYVNWDSALSTIGVTSGKWYFEAKWGGQDNLMIGCVDVDKDPEFLSAQGTYGYVGHKGISYFGQSSNAKVIGNNNNDLYTGLTSFASGDIIGCAIDLDNREMFVHRNGTYTNSGNPATRANPYNMATSINQGGTVLMGVASRSGYGVELNFGNGYFSSTAITSAGSNGNGSLFEYDVPSGYYALNTKNINTYG